MPKITILDQFGCHGKKLLKEDNCQKKKKKTVFELDALTFCRLIPFF